MTNQKRRMEMLKKLADQLFAPLSGGQNKMLLSFMDSPPAPPWRMTSDADIGGHSKAALEWQQLGEGAEVPNFVRFHGQISNKLPVGVAHEFGFAATKSPPFKPHEDLLDFAGLELLIRGDGRTYMFNMEPDTYFNEDLYQHLMQPPQEWSQLMLPFDKFLLTAAGKFRDQQRPLDGGPVLKSIGLSVVDGEEGPFQLDIGYIKAIRSFQPLLDDLRKKQAKGKDRPTVW